MRIFLLLILLPFSTLAQNGSGFLQLYIYPDQCKILINDSLILKSKDKITLPAGTYNLSITAPKLKSISEKITITKDSTLIYRKILGYSDSYRAYKSELTEYNLKKGAMITTTSLLAGLTLYLTYNYSIQAKRNQDKSYDNAMYYKNLYDNGFNSVDLITYENEFNKHKNDYYKYKKQIYYAVPVFIVGSFLSYKSLQFTKSIKKPKYLESVGFNYNIFNNQYSISYVF